MMRLRQVVGIIGVLLMLVSSMGVAVYAQEEGVGIPTESPTGADVAAGDSGVGDTSNDSNPADGEAGDSPVAAEPLPQTESGEEEPSTSDGNDDAVGQPGSEPVSSSAPTVEPQPAEPVAENSPAGTDTEAEPAGDGATGSDTPEEPARTGELPADTRRLPADSTFDTQALEVGDPDANASVAITGLSLSCDGIVTFTTVVNVTYERFEGHLILDIYEGDPAAGGEMMTVVAPSQGDTLLAGSTAYSEDLGWSTSILANPYAQVRWTLTAWDGPTGMDYVGEWRGSERTARSDGCGEPGDGSGEPADGPGDPSDGDGSTNPDPGGDSDNENVPLPGAAAVTAIEASCDGSLVVDVSGPVEILAVATANGGGVGGSWRFSATPGQHTHDFWADGDPAATADDVVFTVYELNEYEEPLFTHFETLSCSGKPFYDVEQFDLTCEGVLTVAYGERQPEYPLYNLYDGETGEHLGSSRSFNGTDFAIEPGTHDSLYAIGEDNWPSLPVYFIADAMVTGCLGGDPDPGPDQNGQIALSLTLQDGSGNPDTSADGATASWTVESLDSVASNPSVNGLRAAQVTPSTYSAVVNGGVASTTSDPFPLGSYRVCLSNILTGGPSGDVSIGDAPICDTVELTEAGATTPAPAAFTATIQNGEPAEPGDGDPSDPGDGAAAPTVVGLTVDIANACGFVGGAGTVTGTTQIHGALDTSRYEATLTVGWETPDGQVRWGEAYHGNSPYYWQSEFEVNGTWSITRAAYDATIGGYIYGPERPANATALFARLSLSQAGPYDAYDSETVRFALAECEDAEPEPVDAGQIELSLRLDDASANADTSADGATASWTVEPLDTVTGNPNINGLRATQTTASTYSAVLANGVASTSTDPLPLGTYRVCLSPVLAGGPNGDITIADAPICDTVELTEAGITTPVAAAFVASIQAPGSPASGGDQGAPSHGAGNGEQPAASSAGGAPTTAHASSVATERSQASSAGTASTAKTPTGQVATTLPAAGTGPAADVSAVLWLMVASLIAATAGFAIRRRATA